jgi:glutaredoxin-like protein NrdH
MVRVYGKPQCVQCEYTKKKLDEKKIPYVYHDITAEPEARKLVEQTGMLQLPLVVAGEQSWHGLSPDKINALHAC